MAGVDMLSLLSSSVSGSMGMKEKATATASRPALMPQTVHTKILRLPTGSTAIMLTQVMTKLVPATTKPTATGFEKPTYGEMKSALCLRNHFGLYSWVSYQSEQRTAIVHQRIESRHLGDDHETASADQSAEVGGHSVELLDLGPARFVLVELFGLLTRFGNERDFCANLFGGSALVDLCDDSFGFGQTTVVGELTG
jgi:hypothetical protein